MDVGSLYRLFELNEECKIINNDILSSRPSAIFLNLVSVD